MAYPSVLNPHPPEFDPFLHAFVGEDRNGYAVTVLSTLARLGLDPWNETSELVTLGHDGARERLGALLARFQDVPALASDHETVARDLSKLLPERLTSVALQHAASTMVDGRPRPSGAVWAVIAIVFVLIQTFLLSGSGSGE